MNVTWVILSVGRQWTSDNRRLDWRDGHLPWGQYRGLSPCTSATALLSGVERWSIAAKDNVVISARVELILKMEIYIVLVKSSKMRNGRYELRSSYIISAIIYREKFVHYSSLSHKYQSDYPVTILRFLDAHEIKPSSRIQQGYGTQLWNWVSQLNRLTTLSETSTPTSLEVKALTHIE